MKGLQSRIKSQWLWLQDADLVNRFWEENRWSYYDEDGEGEIIAIAQVPSDEEIISVVKQMRQQQNIEPRKPLPTSRAWERP